MDSILQELEKLTDSLFSRLMNASYEELEVFVIERQKFVDAIEEEVEKCRPTPAQKDAIRRIMEYDPAIMARMNAHRLDAKDWLMKRNQAKTQRSAYEASYAPDSVLMDRKK